MFALPPWVVFKFRKWQDLVLFLKQSILKKIECNTTKPLSCVYYTLFFGAHTVFQEFPCRFRRAFNSHSCEQFAVCMQTVGFATYWCGLKSFIYFDRRQLCVRTWMQCVLHCKPPSVWRTFPHRWLNDTTNLRLKWGKCVSTYWFFFVCVCVYIVCDFGECCLQYKPELCSK